MYKFSLFNFYNANKTAKCSRIETFLENVGRHKKSYIKWNHFDNSDPRTTNLAEGWHNSLNHTLRMPHPSAVVFYTGFRLPSMRFSAFCVGNFSWMLVDKSSNRPPSVVTWTRLSLTLCYISA